MEGVLDTWRRSKKDGGTCDTPSVKVEPGVRSYRSRARDSGVDAHDWREDSEGREEGSITGQGRSEMASYLLQSHLSLVPLGALEQGLCCGIHLDSQVPCW